MIRVWVPVSFCTFLLPDFLFLLQIRKVHRASSAPAALADEIPFVSLFLARQAQRHESYAHLHYCILYNHP